MGPQRAGESGDGVTLEPGTVSHPAGKQSIVPGPGIGRTDEAQLKKCLLGHCQA